jgi:hypothetical protein
LRAEPACALIGVRTRNRHFVRFAVVAAALLFSVTAVLGAAQFPSPPRLEEVAPAHTIGTGVWLFVVDDGEPMPAISSGGAGQIKIGRLDLDNLESPITWRVVADPADAPSLPIIGWSSPTGSTGSSSRQTTTAIVIC